MTAFRARDFRVTQHAVIRYCQRVKPCLMVVGARRELREIIPFGELRPRPEGGTVDHIIPLCGGGDRTPDNLTGACMACNRRKSRAPLLTFLLRELEREAVA